MSQNITVFLPHSLSQKDIEFMTTSFSSPFKVYIKRLLTIPTDELNFSDHMLEVTVSSEVLGNFVDDLNSDTKNLLDNLQRLLEKVRKRSSKKARFTLDLKICDKEVAVFELTNLTKTNFNQALKSIAEKISNIEFRHRNFGLIIYEFDCNLGSWEEVY